MVEGLTDQPPARHPARVPLTRTASYLLAYELWEAAQDEGHDQAARQLLPLLQYADEQGWSEVAFVAAAALELYEVVRPTGADLDLPGLLHRAGGVPAFEAIARGLAAVAASARGDTEAVHAGARQRRTTRRSRSSTTRPSGRF